METLLCAVDGGGGGRSPPKLDLGKCVQYTHTTRKKGNASERARACVLYLKGEIEIRSEGAEREREREEEREKYKIEHMLGHGLLQHRSQKLL